MSRSLTAQDRSSLIRLASSLPKGSPERKAILAGLSKVSSPRSNFEHRALVEDIEGYLERYFEEAAEKGETLGVRGEIAEEELLDIAVKLTRRPLKVVAQGIYEALAQLAHRGVLVDLGGGAYRIRL